jgi:predicted nuclease with TOPRIM domain
MTEEFTAADAMTEVEYFKPERINEELENERVEVALLLTATTAEAILREELVNHYSISYDAFDELRGNKALGFYVSKCNEYDIIDEKYREAFQDLIDERNELVHDLGYLMSRLDQSNEKVEEVSGTIKKCCKWFDSRRQDT